MEGVVEAVSEFDGASRGGECEDCFGEGGDEIAGALACNDVSGYGIY